MNRLKFVKFNDDSTVEDIVICDHFQVVKLSDFISISTFKGHTYEDGVERRIGANEEFNSCYVENDNGKTVAVYSVKTIAE